MKVKDLYKICRVDRTYKIPNFTKITKIFKKICNRYGLVIGIEHIYIKLTLFYFLFQAPFAGAPSQFTPKPHSAPALIVNYSKTWC